MAEGFKPRVGKQLSSPLQLLWYSSQSICYHKFLMKRIIMQKRKFKSIYTTARENILVTWTAVTLTELKEFLGVFFNMCMNPKPELKTIFLKIGRTDIHFSKMCLSEINFYKYFGHFIWVL
jgi:hypothetical protein